jgi:hypothetical protein
VQLANVYELGSVVNLNSDKSWIPDNPVQYWKQYEPKLVNLFAP